MRKRVMFIVSLLFIVAISSSAYGWPSLNAAVGELPWLQVTATQDLINSYKWYYTVTIDPTAPLGGNINVGGVKALAVYINGGDRGPQLSGFGASPNFYGLSTISNWGFDGGYERSKGVFGFKTGSPSYYIHKGQSVQVGIADFSNWSYTPATTDLFLVHVDFGYYVPEINGNTAWFKPGTPIPEPNGLILLGSSLLSLLGLGRFCRRK
ncbi:MAG: hypothetical protein MUO85_08100 [candidate division Zixibacteria bacterium]|nr:hypothetical protein [candidate division Zixibacteria bacterium]